MAQTDSSRWRREETYAIEIAGKLDPHWSEWFAGLTVSAEAGQPARTTLTGRVDQAALRGILNRLWDLNLTLISVRRLSGPHVAAPRDKGEGS